MQSGLAAAAEVPLAWRITLRGDFMTGQDARDDLRIQGPKAALMVVYHQPIDIFGVDVGLGPGAWFGKSAWWEESYPGPWPGYRFAAGGTYRLTPGWVPAWDSVSTSTSGPTRWSTAPRPAGTSGSWPRCGSVIRATPGAQRPAQGRTDTGVMGWAPATETDGFRVSAAPSGWHGSHSRPAARPT